MAECEWALICDYAFMDARGKMCLIGIFDAIQAKRVPIIHAQAALVVQLRGEPKEALTVRIEIVRPNGSQLTRMDGNAVLGETGGAGLQLNLGPFQVPDYGTYDCNIYVNDERSYTTKFHVQKPAAGLS